jgi:hypothetical protein
MPAKTRSYLRPERLKASCSCYAVWPAYSWTDFCLIVVQQYCAGHPVPEQDGRLVVSSRAKRLKTVLSFSAYVCTKKRYLLVGPVHKNHD